MGVTEEPSCCQALRLDSFSQFVEDVVIDLISQSRLGWRVNVSVSGNADAVRYIRRVENTMR